MSKMIRRKLLSTLCIGAMMTVQATELKLNISKIDTKKGGDIRVYVFVGKDGYPKVHEKALLSQKKRATSESLKFTFKVDNTVDELAIKVFHDEDGNGKVSKNWTGVYPKEGLGFSNKQKLGTFGPPSYEKSKVSKKEFSKTLNISLLYP